MPSADPDLPLVRLLTDHQVAIRLYVGSLLPGESAAADVAQRANATIWEKRHDFEIGSNFKAWAFSIARFEVLNFRKQQARDSRLVFGEEVEELIASEMPAHTDGVDERIGALKACLEKLKPADRELVQTRYYTKRPLAEHAERVGRSVGGLKVTLHRIRTALLRCIESQTSRGEAPIS